MKNKIFINILLLAFVLISFTSCKKFLDVNHNPNVTENSRLDLVFPAGVESSASVLGSSFMSLGGIWAQHWTSDINQPGYMGEDSYSVQSGDYSYDLRGWNSLYFGALKDYEWVRKTAKEQENWNYYLMATVMQCYTYQVMADIWDQIPVNGALIGDSIKDPAEFQTGEQVYSILIDRIDDALSKDFMVSTNTKPEKDDIVFNGDIGAWKAFANTLKLKIYIHQRFAKPAESLAKITELVNSGVSFLDRDAAMTDFKDQSGKGNYWYESNLRSSDGALRASNTLLNYIKPKDPRLDYIFNAPTGGHKGLWQGDYRDKYDSYGDASKPVFSVPNITWDTPTYFISYVESLFLQLEAKMMMNASPAELEALYISAIEEDCSRRGVPSDADLGNIYDQAYGYANFPLLGSKNEQFEMIIKQKWVALVNDNPLETFFDINRTHIPGKSEFSPGDEDFDFDNYPGGELLQSVESVLAPGLLPKRLLFPATEKGKNPHTPPTQSINVPVWWEVANPSVE